MSEQTVADFLEHFGVKGMKWGVKTAEEKTVKRETKAQKYVDKADAYRKEIDILNKRPGHSQYRQQRINDLSEKELTALRDADAKRQGHLSSGQRKAAIGAGAASAVIAAYGAYTVVQSGEMNRSMIKGKAFVNGIKPEWAMDKSLSNSDLDADGILSKVVKGVNPDYGDLGTKQNCRRCTFAYEMRRRGYDVAATKTTNARGQDVSGLLNATTSDGNRIKSGRFGIASEVLSESYRKATGKITDTPLSDTLSSGNLMGKTKIESFGDATTSIFATLKDQPDGSRGELGVNWQIGGGHSMAYEIVKGKPVIFDNQRGKMYKNAEELYSASGDNGIASAAFTRLDNIPLNDDFLMRWLKNA